MNSSPHAHAIATLLRGQPTAIPNHENAPSWFSPLIGLLLDAPPNGRMDAYERAMLDSPDAREIMRAVRQAEHQLQQAAAPAGIVLPRVWPHEALLAETFDPARWILDGAIPTNGLALLGGRKKTGKSWLALELCQCVAAGSPFLGRATAQASVLYACLEDGAARLQTRLMRQNSPAQLPISYTFGPLYPIDQEDGLAQLNELVKQCTPGLLILDTFAACRSARVDENDATAMAAVCNALRELSRSTRCAIVLISHHGKRRSGDDAGDDIRGSSAIGAASDANIGLYRGAAGYALRIEGRDMPETTIPLSLDPQTMRWTAAERADPDEPSRPAIETEILAALAELGEADAPTLAAQLDRDRARVSSALARLAAAGELTATEERATRGAPKKLYSRAP